MLTPEELEKLTEKMWKLVKAFPVERREAVTRMLEGPVGEEFLTAPASAQVDFHNCFPGGLLDHSLRVVDNLFSLSEALCPGRFHVAKLAFVGLFHDFGKVGDGERPYYVHNQSEWHRNKLGRLYETSKECVWMPTSERGLYVLQKFGITVDHEEYLAIRLNDGQYDDTNKAYRMREPDLAVLVHFADRWSCTQEKTDRQVS